MAWWPWLAGWYGVWSIAAFVMFALDKRRAQRGQWRIRERTLHAAEAMGGWPGSIGAMLLLRHKNRKVGFVLMTAGIALAHAGVWVWLLTRPRG